MVYLLCLEVAGMHIEPRMLRASRGQLHRCTMSDSAVANRLPHSIFNRPNGEGGACGMWWPVLLLSPHPYTEQRVTLVHVSSL
jgi:hypothetical protein